MSDKDNKTPMDTGTGSITELMGCLKTTMISLIINGEIKDESIVKALEKYQKKMEKILLDRDSSLKIISTIFVTERVGKGIKKKKIIKISR
jgi:hypothetical protein